MRILRYVYNAPAQDWLPGSTFALVPTQTVMEESTGPELFDVIVSQVKKTDFRYTIHDVREILLEAR